MLRNPIDVIYSLHGQFLFSGNADRASFERALKAEPLRRNGRAIPRTAHFPHGLLYSEVVRYSEQIERFVAHFGRENIATVINADVATARPDRSRHVAAYLRRSQTSTK